MKLSQRFDCYKTGRDAISDFLADFRFEIDYFTNWPNQDHKTMKNLVGTRIKLVLQQCGTSDFLMHGAPQMLEAGGCALIPPYTVYDARTHEHVNSYEIFFNVSPITREQEFLQTLGFTQLTLFPRLLSDTEFGMLHDCFIAMQEKQAGAYMQLTSFLMLVLLRMLKAHQSLPLRPSIHLKEHAVIAKVFAYLDVHLRQPIHVSQLCEHLKVSQSYLYRCSMKVMNCSTSEIIIRYKMWHAQTLLRNPDLTITEVADAIGYDLYYFSSQFKKEFKLSPSAFRNGFGLHN